MLRKKKVPQMNRTEYLPKYLGSYLEIGKCCDVAGFLQMKITLAIRSTVNLYKHLLTFYAKVH